MFIYENEFAAAYNKGKPIKTALGLQKLTTNPISEEETEFMKDKFWYHTNTDFSICIACNPINGHRMPELRSKLLSFGGEEACLPSFEEDLIKILERGQLWYGDRTTFKKGRPSRCHQNSSILWHKNRREYALCTGYALSEDGCWRQHSWLVWLKPRKNRIIETTVGRIAYFGFVMDDKEAKEFYYANCY